MPSTDLPVLPLPFTAPAHSPNPHKHLVVPYAALEDASCQQVLADLELPHLNRLLSRLTAAEVDEAAADSPIPPHERLVARLWGLDPQAPAWAAVGDASGRADAGRAEPSAWFTPCHWTVGADQVRMEDPAHLQLDQAEAEALLAVLQPWFTEDGLHLEIEQPQRWRISGAPLAGLLSASLDRVLLRDVRPWLPDPASARHLHRLHSEVQMLLYTHAFNDRRAERGLPAVNAFWLHGAGRLDQPARLALTQRQPAVQLELLDGLRQAALREHWPAWKAAWLAADAGPLAALEAHVAAGGSATLTLCGERQARSFHTAPRGLFDRLRQALRPTRFADLQPLL